MRMLQITAAPPGWFAVYDLDGEAHFTPIAFWALCEGKDGGSVVIPVQADGLNPTGMFVAEPPGERLLGYMAPSETKEEWQARARNQEKVRQFTALKDAKA